MNFRVTPTTTKEPIMSNQTKLRLARYAGYLAVAAAAVTIIKPVWDDLTGRKWG